jgi:WD40 repeat protein
MKVLNFDQKFGKFSLDYEFIAHLDPIKVITLNGAKGLMVTGCRDGSARVWETDKTGSCSKTFKNRVVANLNGHVDNVSCVEFMPLSTGKNVIATGSWD